MDESKIAAAIPALSKLTPEEFTALSGLTAEEETVCRLVIANTKRRGRPAGAKNKARDTASTTGTGKGKGGKVETPSQA